MTNSKRRRCHPLQPPRRSNLSLPKQCRTKKLRNSINFIQSQIEIAKKNSETSIKDLQEFNVKNNLGTFDGFVLDDAKSNISTDKRPQRFENNFKQLSILETELVRMRSVYKPNATILKNMIKTKNQFEKSLKRPSEILNLYRNKLIKAQRDKNIHENLINQLYLLEFEKILARPRRSGDREVLMEEGEERATGARQIAGQPFVRSAQR